MDNVSAIFRPFAEKVDRFGEAGNFLHGFCSSLHEEGAAEILRVNFGCSNSAEHLSMPGETSMPSQDYYRTCCQCDDGSDALSFKRGKSHNEESRSPRN